jgi:WD40 repeat protein
VAAEHDARVCLWNVDDGRVLRELDTRGEGVRSLEFSPDGNLLAIGCQNNTAQLWDIPSGKQRATLRGHLQEVIGVAFSPDGKTLATGGDDRKVKLWNIATHQEVATLGPLDGGCRSLRFSPDGRSLAVGHYRDPKSYLWLWQAPSFEEIAAAESKKKPETN